MCKKCVLYKFLLEINNNESNIPYQKYIKMYLKSKSGLNVFFFFDNVFYRFKF